MTYCLIIEFAFLTKISYIWREQKKFIENPRFPGSAFRSASRKRKTTPATPIFTVASRHPWPRTSARNGTEPPRPPRRTRPRRPPATSRFSLYLTTASRETNLFWPSIGPGSIPVTWSRSWLTATRPWWRRCPRAACLWAGCWRRLNSWCDIRRWWTRASTTTSIRWINCWQICTLKVKKN